MPSLLLALTLFASILFAIASLATASDLCEFQPSEVGQRVRNASTLYRLLRHTADT